MSAIIPVKNDQLPVGFCPGTYQEMLDGFTLKQHVDMTDVVAGLGSGIVVSGNTPSDHDKPWLKLDSDGKPERIYYYYNGVWLSRHPIPSGMTMIWNQALPDFGVYDGGSGLATDTPTESTGPMWQLMATNLDGTGATDGSDKDVLAARFPVGVGQFTNVDGGVGRTIAVRGLDGFPQVRLEIEEVPPHVHKTRVANNRAVSDNASDLASGGFIGPYPGASNIGPEISTKSAGGDIGTDSDGNPTHTKAHENLPPCYGVYFLQRTYRVYYRVNP